MIAATRFWCDLYQRYARIESHLLLAIILFPLVPLKVQAQVPANPFSYSRTSLFSYYTAADGAKAGLLASETIEPNQPQLCVTTSYLYDAFGNKSTATTANCQNASGHALFTGRTSQNTYPTTTINQSILVNGQSTMVAVVAGLFPATTINAKNQSESKTYDPRFGVVLSLTGPNNLTTQWKFDDFGRVIEETRADTTKMVTAYCVLAVTGLDTSSNSVGCPTPVANEAPADAVTFVQATPTSNAGAPIGPFVRTYSDRLGRSIRVVTESFDGDNQPSANNAALIVRDVVYNSYGAKVLETQPYFLSTGSSKTSGSNDVGVTETEYDLLGRPVVVYVADVHGSQASRPFGVTRSGVEYGSYGSSPAAKQTITYFALKTSTINDKLQKRDEEKNVNGELTLVTDFSGAQLAHQRDAFGNLITTLDALKNSIAVTYDFRGRKTKMVDPDSGTWNYDYDALGQLVWQQSPNQLVQQLAQGVSVATTMAYDQLGRMTQRTEPEYTSNWSYDTYADQSACNWGVGKLCESGTTTGVNRKFAYDNLGRPLKSRTTVASGPSFATALSYEPVTGRIATQTYPTGLKVGYNYTTRGYLQSLVLLTPAVVNPLPNTPGGTAGPSVTIAPNSALWTAKVVSAWGNAEQHSFGSGVTGMAGYEAATGRITSLAAGASGNVLSQQYAWDSLNRLTTRIDDNGDTASGISTGAVSEVFTYSDGLNRLTQYQVSAPAIPAFSRTVDLQYNALGMLLYKTDVGNYNYGPQGSGATRPHALQSTSDGTVYTYDANGNLKTASAGKYRSISYTSFNLPDSQSGVMGPSGLPQYRWQYDENHARIKEEQVTSAGTRTLWYAHADNQGGLSFEYEVPAGSNTAAASNRHFLSAGGQVIGVLVSAGPIPVLPPAQLDPPSPLLVSGNYPLNKVEYWHKDHLGSLITTTDHAGTVTQRYAYDPFGKRRYVNGSYDEFGSVVIDWTSNTNKGTSRGFTSHEHLDDIGLVNMNGRIFDPTLGRFLQPDPVVQNNFELQNYNRYGYCYNNPMTCTDPSGLSWFYMFEVAWRDPEFRGMLAMFVAVVIGAPNGATGWAAFGQAAEAGFVSGAIASNSLQGGVQGAFTSAAFFGAGNLIDGGNFFTGGGTDPASASKYLKGVALHGVVGCVTSVASGGQCGPGALSAAFAKALTPAISGIAGDNHFAGIFLAAAVGGTSSQLGGGKFENGAKTAAFGYLFNELLHQHDGTAAGRRRAMQLSGHHDIYDPALEGVYPEEFLVGGLTIKAGKGLLTLLATDGAVIAEREVAQVTLNKIAGDGFRDEVAGLLRQAGYQAEIEVSKWTIFGRRVIDIDVWKNGVNLGGIETKVGGAVYNASQRAKDAWLKMGGYIVNVVRGP